MNKSFDLVKWKILQEDYKKYRRPAMEIKSVKHMWNEAMKKSEEAGYNAKDLINNQVETIRFNDLDFLKSVGGPFSKPEEIDDFMSQPIDNDKRTKRLYTEVRYAKNSCISMKHSASVFRLKRNHSNLDAEEYASNLKQYLGDTRKKKNLTISDLSAALHKMNNEAEDSIQSQSVELPKTYERYFECL